MATAAHAVLRDRGRWRGRMRGLAVRADGDLSLARVPAPADGRSIDIPGSYPHPRVASGLALGPCDAVFVADTAHDRILFVDGMCGARAWLPARSKPVLDAPGHFASPRGLAAGPDYLLVADHGHGALQQLAFPRLEANRVSTAVALPLSVALDELGNQFVVDAARGRVHRILASGTLDTTFEAPDLHAPFGVTVNGGGDLLVSDTDANAVFLFEADGRFIRKLPGPAGWLPGALAARGALIFVADAATGAILVFAEGTLRGVVDGWRAPVTALAVGENGDLYVKPGLDATYFRFTADAAFVHEGELLAGPFDAGEERVWERAWIEAEVTPAGRADVEVALKANADPPLPTEWVRLPSSDALLARDAHGSARFVWLRLRLATTSANIAPVVRQLRCATAAEDYLDYLPLTFRRHDRDGFLSRWLKLLRGEFGLIEESIEALPRLADPGFVPAGSIGWLAQWFGLELPQIAGDDEARALIGSVVQLFARRGSPATIAHFVELHTGIRPAIVEAFEERRVWVLGVSSRLDFDTRLAPLDPAGIVVPDSTLGGECPGAVGSLVVGASGPLAPYQIGLPLFADEAYRFCVVVDGYRLRDAKLLAELCRIVDREKPAHTDYRVQVVAPEMRVGLQARIGIDAIVGGDAARRRTRCVAARYRNVAAAQEVARVGDAYLDGTLALN